MQVPHMPLSPHEGYGAKSIPRVKRKKDSSFVPLLKTMEATNSLKEV